MMTRTSPAHQSRQIAFTLLMLVAKFCPRFELIKRLLVTFAIATLSACQLPAMEYERNDFSRGHDNLARFLTNRAVKAFYLGDTETAVESLDLALEIRPQFDEAHNLRERLSNPDTRPGFVRYSGPPAWPAAREVPGQWARWAAYPIWGLPFDVLESPLKGLSAVPGLGAVTYPLTFLFYPFEPPDGDDSLSLTVGAGASSAGGGGFRVSSSTVLVYLLLNALPAVVYQDRWHERLELWGRVGCWWWPSLAARLHSRRFDLDRGVASGFFPNIRRISIVDQRIDRLRDALEVFSTRSLASHNDEIKRFNSSIARFPKETTKRQIAKQLFLKSS